MLKNRNGRGLRRKKVNVVEPGEPVESDDGKPAIRENVKVLCISLIPFVFLFIMSLLFARYWGELRPDSQTYARLSNLLYTAELCT